MDKISLESTAEFDLLRALEADTYAFWIGFSNRPGGTSGHDGGSRWFRSGIPLMNYNGIVGSPTDVGEVDATLARVRAWGVPARWMLSDASVPEGLASTFAKSGLTIVDESAGMVARIEEIPGPASAAMTVEVVRDETQFNTWVEIFCDAFGVTSESAPHVHDAHVWPWRRDDGRRYLLMRCDGVAVATGLLHLSSGVAGVYGIGVRRAFQRRGFGALATMHTVRVGACAGALIAVLQATKQGFPLYKKLGFQKICAFQSWRIA